MTIQEIHDRLERMYDDRYFFDKQIKIIQDKIDDDNLVSRLEILNHCFWIDNVDSLIYKIQQEGVENDK